VAGQVGSATFSDLTPSEKRAIHFGSVPARLYRVFASILRYHRMAAKCEVLHGGVIPLEHLKDFISGWAREVMPMLRLQVERVGPIPPLDTPAIFVGNHLSYLDIPVLMSQVPIALLGKAEIARWPILGAAGRRAGMVFVKRESNGSRKDAARAIVDCLRSRGMSMGLFPAGTTSLDEGRPWRAGAFKIARLRGFPIQPFRLSYEPLEQVAFVGEDYLLPHLYRLLKAGPIRARIEFGEPRLVEDPEVMAGELWNWTRQASRT
jgi:1-acyl-sn-glycerol-3-phosphate acyltransferase